MNWLGKIGWGLRRVSVMSFREVLHHLHGALLDRFDPRFRPGATLPKLYRETGHLARLLDPRSRQLFRPKVQGSADWDRRLLAGEALVFGTWVPINEATDVWHTDPLTHAAWSRVPYPRIDYRPGNPTGDVRIVWEINRLQHLFLLADLAERENAHRSAAVSLLERHLASWEAANPFGIGVNYISAMEEALRLVAVLHAYDLVRGWVSNDTRERVARLALSHAHHVERRLSLYSSAGNHTIAEAVGLLYAGLLLPESPSARIWYRKGRELLASEAARQVDRDGGGIEQATWYLLFICDLLGLAQALLAHLQCPAEPAIDSAVARAREFLNALAWDAGSLPRIGDADDGFALAARLQMTWREQEPRQIARTFETAGVSIVRHGETDRLLFLHKSLGMPPNFAHGHADALSVLFRWRGAEVLIDPGTYCYGREPELRRYFRSTAAHNTVVIGDSDQAEQAGPFMWRRPFSSRLLMRRVDDRSALFLAVNDGYRGQGYLHARGVAYRFGEFVAIWDRLTGTGAGPCQIHWGFGIPAVNRREDGRGVRLTMEDGSPIDFEVSGGCASVASGQTNPRLGWVSGVYGSLATCDTVSVAFPAIPRDPVVSVFWLTPARDWSAVMSLVGEFERPSGVRTG